MIEIICNLYIGSQDDFENNVKHKKGWFVIQACKEPYHRQALGYTGRAVSKDHPEYLMAKREDKLILNLVDVDNPTYISKDIIDAAIEAIRENILLKKVLLHCNQGGSRSATIGLLYLHLIDIISTNNFNEAEQQYLKLYPHYNPANGMRSFALNNWDSYKCILTEKQV
jgi:hypothetical protein